MEAGLISIVMAMHNSEAFVGQAIASCLGQTYTRWELIVVDDGSLDESWKVVEDVTDSRVRAVRLPTNVGPGRARNVALDLARGEWITVLDSDDEFHSERLALLYQAASDSTGDRILLDRIQRWEMHAEPPAHLLRSRPEREQPRDWPLAEWLVSSRRGQPFFPSWTLADPRIRYPDTRAAQDTAFTVRLAAYTGLNIHETGYKTYFYRRRPTSLSVKSAERQAELERTYQLLLAEHTGTPALETALLHVLQDLRERRFYLQVRMAFRRCNPGALVRTVRASPDLLVHSVKRMPSWLRERSGRMIRHTAQRCQTYKGKPNP